MVQQHVLATGKGVTTIIGDAAGTITVTTKFGDGDTDVLTKVLLQ